jgi:sulfur-oxidizing protein SoxX
MSKLVLAVLLGAIMTRADAATLAPTPVITAVSDQVETDSKVLFENNNLGNCLACHAVIKHPEMTAGNIGPPFIAMKARFPDKAKLHAIIYDEQVNNPDTIMPPFGRNKVLTKEQINAIVDYILQF